MIDTHCHVDEDAYASDRDAFIARQQAEGVRAIIVPGIDAQSIETVLAAHKHWPAYCYPCLGLHPENIADDWQEQLATIYDAIVKHRSEIVAVGEIGMDYHFSRQYEQEQKQVFATQLRWARELDLPVIVHSRDATADTLQIVRTIQDENGSYPLRGVAHCYNGSAETAREWMRMGFYLGIGGVITFKNCHLADTLASTPESIDRILLETDGPYMAPVPHRGERNEPYYMIHVATKLAEVYGKTTEQIIALTSAHAKQLFRL